MHSKINKLYLSIIDKEVQKEDTQDRQTLLKTKYCTRVVTVTK